MTEDGTATDMNAAFADGYLTFATAHFSVYAVVDENAVLGDVNGDGIFNMADAALVRRYVANMDVSVDTSAADVSIVTFRFATYLRTNAASAMLNMPSPFTSPILSFSTTA